jgi:hypothetical protein
VQFLHTLTGNEKIKLKSALPAGLKNHQCERFDPLHVGGLLPVRFVPNSHTAKVEGEEKEKEHMIKSTILDSIQKYYPIFKEGDTKDVVNLIQCHESIISDKKLRTCFNVCASLITDKKKSLKKLQAKARKRSDDLTEIAAHKTAIKEYQTQASSVQEEAFNNFEKLLNQTVVPLWRNIVTEQYDTDGYVDFDGHKKTGKLGRVFGSLQACYLQFILSVSTQDSVERHKHCISTTIKKADIVTIVQLLSHLTVLNEMTRYLPCLKHVENSPSDLKKMNVPFTELEMCTNVIASRPLSISMEYYAHKGVHFPMKLNMLEEDFIPVTASVQRHDKIIADICAKAGFLKKGLDQDKTSTKSLDKSIPKKAKFGNNSSNGGKPHPDPGH